jgi:DNA topoisomerase-1
MSFKTKCKTYLENIQYKLYSLIWKRTIATQMAVAKIANTTYKIEAGKNKEFEFQKRSKNYFCWIYESLYRR